MAAPSATVAAGRAYEAWSEPSGELALHKGLSQETQVLGYKPPGAGGLTYSANLTTDPATGEMFAAWFELDGSGASRLKTASVNPATGNLLRRPQKISDTSPCG